MIRIVDLFRRHYRLASTPYLLLFDCIFIAFLVYDCYRYGAARLSVAAVPWTYFLQPQQDAENIVFFFFTLTVLVPLAIAFLRVTGIVSLSSKSAGVIGKRTILYVHLIVSLLLAWSCVFAHNMEVVSGYVLANDEVQTLFHSYFHSVINSPLFGKIPGLIGLAVTLGGPIIIHYAFQGDDLPKWLKQYVVRARLADLAPALRPVRRQYGYLLREGGVPPEVPAVVQASDKALRNYRDLNDGRLVGSVDTEMDNWKREAARLLFSPSDGKTETSVDIEVFTEYNRAMEAALARVHGSKLIVACPYATPSLVAFLNWYSLVTANGCTVIKFEAGDYLREWSQQQAKILDAVQTLNVPQGSCLIFVLSEVSYATGRRVPLTPFLQDLRTALPNTRLSVVVDGRNAVGNRKLLSITPNWDCYLFNPHRWLMAREPCGVLLVKDRANGELSPFGSWRAGVKKTDAQLRVLAGLRGSATLLENPGFDELLSRCEDLRRELRLGLPDRMKIVGDNSGMEETFLLSCQPSPGNAWRFESSDLEANLVAKKLPASLLNLDPLNPWVRVTLPYYLDVRDINRLCGFLGEATRG